LRTLLHSSLNQPTICQRYTLSLHDALPISLGAMGADCGNIDKCDPRRQVCEYGAGGAICLSGPPTPQGGCSYRCTGGVCEFSCRSEEHTSELQSLRHLVCRLLLEKKNATGN